MQRSQLFSVVRDLACEHREPDKETLLVEREQTIAPVDRVTQRLLSG